MLQKSGEKVLVFIKRTYFNFSGRGGSVSSSNLVRPMERAPTIELNQIPKHIRIPDYAHQEFQSVNESAIQKIPILNSEDVKKARRASQLARKMIHFASTLLAPGVSTDHLNSLLHDEIIRLNAYPSTLFYEGFPKSISTSVNNIAVHGVPDSRRLQDGDILTIDVTVYTDDGFHGDCCETFCVGENIDSNARHLLTVTKECLYAGISTCGPKIPFASVGSAIKSHAKRRKLSIVPHIIGHGIGAAFHSPPEIYHTLNNYPGLMEPGMLFTIEPCLSEGGTSLMLLEDKFSYATVDDSRTAQCEHTILITKHGVEILTV